MQAFGAVVLLALSYYVPTICKKVADNLKVRIQAITRSEGSDVIR
jgi:hypothetical protein